MKQALFGLVALAYAFILTVSGALESDAEAGNHLMRAQTEEANAAVYADQNDHAGAGRCYALAVRHYRSHAEARKTVGDQLGAADNYSKAAAMVGAVSKHENMLLIDALTAFVTRDKRLQEAILKLITEYAEMGDHQKRHRLHIDATHGYCQLAKKHVRAGESAQALAMSRALARQYEAKGKYEQARGVHASAALAYFFAYSQHRANGDLDHLHTIKKAEARMREAMAVALLANNDYGAAVYQYTKSLAACEESGDLDMARSMREVLAESYEAIARVMEAQHQKVDAATCYGNAAKFYEQIVDLYRAKLMRAAEARLESRLRL